MQIWTKKLATVALSVVILGGTYGCAGLPNAGGPGAGGQQQGASGGAEGGGTVGQAEGSGGGILGGIGGIVGSAARDGVGMAGRGQTDMGQQISQVVGQALSGAGTGGFLGMGADDPDAGAGGPAAGGVGVSTLVIGNIALVGVDLNTAGAETGIGAPGGAGGGMGAGMADGMSDVKGTVKNQVRATFPQVADVFVTTDPELVYQISVIAGDIQQGVSVLEKLEEVFLVARRMAPTKQGAGEGL